MKVEVITTFIDKIDHVTEYKVGQVLDLADSSRCEDLINRGLAKAVIEPKPSRAKKKAAEVEA